MAWKPKEKEVTPEEAIALAKKELAPFWHGSTPLVCGVEDGETVHAQPLDPLIINGTWMLFFGDPMGLSGDQARYYLQEFKRRYDHLGIRFIWIFKPLYQFQSLPRAVDQLMKRLGPDIPVVRDTRSLLSGAFGMQALPKLVVIHNGKLVMNPEGQDWMKGTELALQNFLRSNDPGLPLLPVFETSEKFTRQVNSVEFGTGRGSVIKLEGNWEQDQDRITTSDASASMTFSCPGSILAVVAQSLSRDQDPAVVQFEVDGFPIEEACFGADLLTDDEGRKIIRVEAIADLHEALINLPRLHRKITLRFPFAKRAAIALYGLRFGERG